MMQPKNCEQLNRLLAWRVVGMLVLFLSWPLQAQIQRLSYSFETNGDEGQGESLYALNRGYFPLTNTGNFLANGRAGFALEHDILVVGSLAPISVNTPLTISIWFKATEMTSTRSLLSRTNPLNGSGLSLDLLTSGQAQMTLTDEAGGQFVVRTSDTVLPDDQWHHLTFTFKSELEEYQFYLDGDAVAMDEVSRSLLGDVSTSHPLIISGNADLQPFQGAVDELQIIPQFFAESNVQCLTRLALDCAYRPTQATRGPRGEQGDRGPMGPRGLKGVTGPQGEPGDVGVAGSPGPKGEQGPVGLQGIQGPKGLTGINGADGLDGSDGKNGRDGPVGDEGPAGDEGPRGEIGDRGPQGPIGEIGLKGPTGPKGDTGLVGLEGDVGPDGDKGPRGNAGIKGITGLKGSTGAKGDKGATGDRGYTGGKGATGLKGYTGPRGLQGDKGATGDRGPRGPQGYSGCHPNSPNRIPACDDAYPYYRNSGALLSKQAGSTVGANENSALQKFLSLSSIDLSDYGVRDIKVYTEIVYALREGRSHLVLAEWAKKNPQRTSSKPLGDLYVLLKAADELMELQKSSVKSMKNAASQ